MAQYEDQWGSYDFYGNPGQKSQSSATHNGATHVHSGMQVNGNLIQTGLPLAGPVVSSPAHDGTIGAIGFNPRTSGSLGNGRICWHCSETSYGLCLSSYSASHLGDSVRHGASYCQGEDYFCFISERRIIRHDGNDYNFEMGQPWSEGTNIPVYQEENTGGAHTTSNTTKNTKIRVEMGCQQPSACLRQMNMNYKIDIGLPFHTMTARPIATNPAAKFAGLAREGLCRLGKDWLDYASGQHALNKWSQISDGFNDPRYGAGEHHYNFGKGTESVCHYCCDPLLERTGSTPYSYNGCNYDAIGTDTTTISSATAALQNVDGDGDISGNVFINRQQQWDTPIWYNAQQYHGMFRNPHTQYERTVKAHNAYTDSAGNRTPNKEDG